MYHTMAARPSRAGFSGAVEPSLWGGLFCAIVSGGAATKEKPAAALKMPGVKALSNIFIRPSVMVLL
jgi:hypothetical protein